MTRSHSCDCSDHRSYIGHETRKLFVNFVLDETGSMSGVLHATINGFNEYVNQLRRNHATRGALLTLTKFNSIRTEVVCAAALLSDAPRLNADTYRPDGMTPLYDAVARAINEAEHVLSQHLDGRHDVLFVIQTDGQENDSRVYTWKSIKALIERKRTEGWTFVFLGANQDAWNAERWGIPRAGTVSYDHTPRGTIHAFAVAANHTMVYAATGNLAATTANGLDIRGENNDGAITARQGTGTNKTGDDGDVPGTTGQA